MSTARVIARLREIDRRLPRDDGVRWFNDVYLRVTERVDARLRAGDFEDPRFTRRLDEDFADLYFEALGSRRPAAWLPLLRSRSDHDIVPARLMLAGINAHVNYDLPIALVTSSRQLGGTLAKDTPRHRDFERIDDILGEVEDEMRCRLRAGRLKEVAALWGIIRARDGAWDAATKLATLNRERRARYLRELDRRVADWSELLLHMP